MKRLIHCATLLIVAAFSISNAQAQTTSANNAAARPNETNQAQLGFGATIAHAAPADRRYTDTGFSFSLTPVSGRSAKVTKPFFNIGPTATASGPNLPVLGGGALGHLTKWTGLTTGNSFIGDTTIFENKYGNVGVGTDSPMSRLSVAGTIESLSGGIKFPDGTVQTTAGVAPTQVVKTINGLNGDVTLSPGPNISITPSLNTLTIGATGLLTAVAHNSTLSGAGTSVSPLSVASPLNLTGSINANGVINAQNLAGDGFGILGVGTRVGVGAQGRIDANGDGGGGVAGFGSDAAVTGGNGGDGIEVTAGDGFGASNASGVGILAFGGIGRNGATDGDAGHFGGDVSVSGMLSKGGGSFKIDHPLDPENKYLYHSFVESTDMMNIYNGNVTTDANGDAVVKLPDWFEALNKDFRYQLTVIGTFAQAIVSTEMKDNRFTIKTNAPNVKVSWLVTGTRQDAWANSHRIPVEETKSDRERGYYLHPEAFDQPDEKNIEWARHPDLMRRTKQMREQTSQKISQRDDG